MIWKSLEEKVGDKIVLVNFRMLCVCRWMLLFHTVRRVTMLVLERAHMLTRALQRTYLPSTTAWTSKLKKKTHLESVSSINPTTDRTLCLIWCYSSSSNRKRTLNFDVEAGMVSDSMVANSLYPQNQNQNQNGSDASSSGAAPLKTEPSDS